ncbi:DNA modification methylase [Boudabousia liubingyangii]|uniref:Methyltransferase n=1 Tax=Boudabousia liubingyangii TaxID=1921764 RepID=A0A1Q5PMP2_9ACTO|nr:site-specific DNA-methyltransferase [Boudabousia liubingyangii]OKL48828.1 DNA modification methylase [Boudabousia liubingyangii]
MNIKKIAVSELQAADYNPRKDLQPGDPEFEKLKRSVEEFGYVEPVIFNEATGRVVGGHQRLKVLTALGHEVIECVVVDLEESKEKALNVALNKVKGEWDESKLAMLIADLQAEDFDVTLTGFDPAEVDALFRDQLAGGIEEDDFDVEAELAKPAMSKTGDIWQLGRHRLIVGDSTDPATFEALMGDEKANLVVTDPPYNVNYQGSAGSIQNDHMDNDSFVAFLTKAFTAVSSVMADDASIYVFHSDTGGYAFRKAFDDAGFYLSGCCIWVKQSIVLGRSPYQWQHEPVLFGWKKKGRHQWYTGRKESTIWRFDKPRKNTDHPTMKPVELIVYPILNSSLSNQIVLDAFGGSGSTLVAAEQTGRVARLVELDPKYADVIINRYKELAGATSGIKVMRDGQELSFEQAQPDADSEGEG